ncbi:MAG: DUF3352 domain-containing protein [Synechococcales bacterium]|nr:DUF3352 domain-containing protein [Synechococcales bacterium]
MAKKRAAVIIAVGAIAALVAGGVTAYWFLVQRRLETSDLPVGGTVVPPDALMTLSFSTDERQWEQLRRFGTEETQAALNQALAEWRDRLLTDNGLNYQTDVAPWVGDTVTVALLTPNQLEAVPPVAPEPSEPSEAPEAPEAPGAIPADPGLIDPTAEQPAVILLPIDDPLKARSLLTDDSRAGGEATEETYQGQTIYTFQGQAGKTLAATVLDRLLVLSTEQDALQQVIDTHQADTSMADTAGYRQAFQEVATPQPFLQIYINSDTAASLAAANSIQGAPPQALAPLQEGTQGIAATVALDNTGVKIQGVTWLKDESDRTFNRVQVERLPALLPADTVMMVAGGNLQQFWQEVESRTTDQTNGLLSPQNLQSAVQAITGLNIDEDLMPWMTDEFALALVSAPDAGGADTMTGVLALVETSDRPAADQAFAKLDGVLRDRYAFQGDRIDQAGIAVTQWSSSFATLTLSQGWLSDRTAFLAVGDIVDTLASSPEENLAATDLFQQATTSEVGSPGGYFFVNLERLIQLDSTLPVPNLPQNQAAVARAIRAIGITTSVPNQRTTRFDISVLLESLDNPGTIP